MGKQGGRDLVKGPIRTFASRPPPELFENRDRAAVHAHHGGEVQHHVRQPATFSRIRARHRTRVGVISTTTCTTCTISQRLVARYPHRELVRFLNLLQHFVRSREEKKPLEFRAERFRAPFRNDVLFPAVMRGAGSNPPGLAESQS